MKKVLALTLTLAMLFVMCIGGSAFALDENEKVTLHLYGTANFVDVGPDGVTDLVSGVEMPGYNELISYWNELHPNVEVFVETCP